MKKSNSHGIPLLSVVKIKATDRIGIVANKHESGSCGLYLVNTDKDSIYNYRAWFRSSELSIIHDRYNSDDIIRMIQVYDMRD